MNYSIKKKMNMNTLYKIFSGILICAMAWFTMACKDEIDPIITELNTARTFAPVGLEALVRNQIEIELSWTARTDVDEYIIEYFQDSLQFIGDPISTTTITVIDIPSDGTISYTQAFAGDTRYSARIKAIIGGEPESKWATTTARTNPEQIFIVGSEIAEDSYATVFWQAGKEVSNFLILPGNIIRPISDAEKTAGEATIEGLAGATDYEVTIYNDIYKRGTTTFSTIKQADLTPLDDLAAAIDAAAEGATLVLAPGTYDLGDYFLTKSIVLEGQKASDMPIVIGRFQCNVTVASFSAKSIHFQGDNEEYSQFFNAEASTCNVSTIHLDGCEISGYRGNIIYNNRIGTYGDIIIEDSYIHDVPGGGGDGFDFRSGSLNSLTVRNSTLANGLRQMLRNDVEADVVFTNVTFYNMQSNYAGHFFRMTAGGSIEVSNCLFAESGILFNDVNYGNFARSGHIPEGTETDYSNNFYYNNIGFLEGQYTDPAEFDGTEEDPGFEDPENGDFTITNQNLIDKKVGDPRWWF